MGRLERAIVALSAGIACPYLTFIAFWWTAATIHRFVIRLTEGAIMATALAGLVIGCTLDIVFLGRWVEKFYTANLRWMLVVYVSLFVVAFASFMGFPLGTFLLGVVVGAYVGRRELHHQSDRDRMTVASRRAALLSSCFTTGASLPIAVLGLKEQIVSTAFENLSGLDRRFLSGAGGFVLICLFCVLLFAAQYWCSRKAADLAFGLGTRSSPQVSPACR